MTILIIRIMFALAILRSGFYAGVDVFDLSFLLIMPIFTL